MMKTLASLALGMILGISAAPLAAAAASETTNSAAETAMSAAQEADVFLVEVMSPWGYSDWYWVEHGRNGLICTTTGNPFVFYY